MKPMKVAIYIITILFPLAAMADATKTTEVAETITQKDPAQMVEQTTDKVLQLADEAKSYVDQDPQRYYEQVEAVLEKVVDVDYFARGVMGTYGSGRLYKSLETDEERQAFRDRVGRFAQILKESFITTYADALLAFDGVRVELKEPASQQEPDEMTLAQTIYNDANQPYSVLYRLHKNREGNWQVYNVLVEGINMGATYRSQFAQAVEDHGGDVDFVVNNWSRIMKNPEELAQAGNSETYQ